MTFCKVPLSSGAATFLEMKAKGITSDRRKRLARNWEGNSVGASLAFFPSICSRPLDPLMCWMVLLILIRRQDVFKGNGNRRGCVCGLIPRLSMIL